jgi:hypothetical protein
MHGCMRARASQERSSWKVWAPVGWLFVWILHVNNSAWGVKIFDEFLSSSLPQYLPRRARPWRWFLSLCHALPTDDHGLENLTDCWNDCNASMRFISHPCRIFLGQRYLFVVIDAQQSCIGCNVAMSKKSTSQGQESRKCHFLLRDCGFEQCLNFIIGPATCCFLVFLVFSGLVQKWIWVYMIKIRQAGTLESKWCVLYVYCFVWMKCTNTTYSFSCVRHGVCSSTRECRKKGRLETSPLFSCFLSVPTISLPTLVASTQPLISLQENGSKCLHRTFAHLLTCVWAVW